MSRALLESTAVRTANRKFRPYPTYRRSEVWGVPAIPEHWQDKPLKCLVAINTDKLPETTDPDYEIEYVDIGNVNLEAGITSTEKYRFENAPSRARRKVRHGDTIVSTVRTYLKAVAQVVNPPDNLIVSTGFAVLRAKPPLHPGFLYRLAQSEPLVERIMAHSVGVSYPAINASEIGRFVIPIPPLDEQRAVAAFLDRETARIDELIAKKQRLIELLKEKRQAVISRAVTKGLDPNAPMKPSGIDWLGDVPAHWEIKKVKHLTRILRGKFTHRPRNDPRMYDGPYPFIQTGDVATADKYIREYAQTLSEEGFAVSKQFPKGTLVMTIAANIGDMAVLDFEACFPDSIVGFVPVADVSLNYLYFLFKGMRQALLSTATLNTQLNLNIDRIGALVTVLPPMNEQGEIVKTLEAEQKQTTTTIRTIREAAQRLRQYRSALITAAVTGQIDVRDYQAEAIS